MSVENEEDVNLFQTIGLSEQKAKETLKNANITKNLKLTINEVGEDSPANRQSRYDWMLNVTELSVFPKLIIIFIMPVSTTVV